MIPEGADMARHLSLEELNAGLPHILGSPPDDGEVRAIVVRPAHGERHDLESCEMSLAGGMHGDHWARGCWKTTDDGKPHPDVQICIMNSRCIGLIAGARERWPLAGDNLFVDLDLRPSNLVPGQRLQAGTAVIEITDTAHLGCQSFSERYGRDATVFVNKGDGRENRLRGIYARVVTDGRIAVGDRLRKL